RARAASRLFSMLLFAHKRTIYGEISANLRNASLTGGRRGVHRKRRGHAAQRGRDWRNDAPDRGIERGRNSPPAPAIAGRVLRVLPGDLTRFWVSHWFDQCDSKRFDRPSKRRPAADHVEHSELRGTSKRASR